MLDNHMKYKDLRDFITLLEQRGLLKRITQEIDPYLEMTEIADRTLRAGGPALLFENPKGYGIPVLANLFGTPERVALGMGQEDITALRQVGEWMAMLKEPEPLVYFLNFGESTLDHELRVHVRELADRNAAIDEISREIDRRFRENGIEIAYNQVDVHIRSVANGKEALLQTIGAPSAAGDKAQ